MTDGTRDEPQGVPVTILNLGSINVDHVYRVPRHVAPGETLSSEGLTRGLGGKGANQSVAVARAGGSVVHIGAVGPDADWALDILRGVGVDTAHVARVDAPTGHAIITVDRAGENAILVHRGANGAIARDSIGAALDGAGAGDWFLAQNETSLVPDAVAMARGRGLRVAYSAAPFEVGAVRAVLPHADLLVVNAIEASQARDAIPGFEAACGRLALVVTRGPEGATWRLGAEAEGWGAGTPRALDVPAPRVTPVDTTGAGDTFLGYLLAGIDGDGDVAAAMRRAARAAALQVTRPGAIDAIPRVDELDPVSL